MPHVYVDTEAAELVEAAVQMFEAALTARVKRADPNKFISNSLILQAGKLRTFRTMLASADPPTWGGLREGLQKKAIRYAAEIASMTGEPEKAAAWEQLRAIINAPGFSGA